MAASQVFEQISESVDVYNELDYKQLAEVVEQWPIIGREDVYYGGTGYNNKQGLGVQLPTKGTYTLQPFTPNKLKEVKGLMAVPVTKLMDRGSVNNASQVLQPRLIQPYVVMNPDDAEQLGIEFGDLATVKVNSVSKVAEVYVDMSQPAGTVQVPRSIGLPINGPCPVSIKPKGGKDHE